MNQMNKSRNLMKKRNALLFAFPFTLRFFRQWRGIQFLPLEWFDVQLMVLATQE